MKKEIETVNSVVLPSMIAESFKQPFPKLRVFNEEGTETTKREEETARKLPKGLPPKPPKSKSKSK